MLSRRRGRRGRRRLAPIAVVSALRVPPVSGAAHAAPEAKPAATAADPHTLWYSKPAADREFNEKILGTGGPGSHGHNLGNWSSPRPNAIQEVVDEVNAKGKAAPSWVAGKLGQERKAFAGGATYDREYFASHADKMIAGRLGANQSGALPGAWKSGSFRGLKARRNVTVDASWKERGAAEFIFARKTSGEIAYAARCSSARQRSPTP
ncbi:glycoside hydrolase family 95-like protein [Streptomyces sp. NPDC086554]|uniref:glycoside hydrolase family 95-like protein n=1 Tax=Streptomyces sp. NPDC086554 TaxID=3154864 RepID=UPI0034194ACE